MRVLVVTNITPDAKAPGRGNYVRDQVAALRDAGLDADLLSFPMGKRALARAAAEIRRRLRKGGYDLVHAHYGLAGWCAALAGARPLVVTFHGTDVRHPAVGRLSRRLISRLDVVAAASRALFDAEGGRPGLPRDRGGAIAVLPCGADISRFSPSSRSAARARLGLEPHGRYLLFPAAPFRPEKRHDLALELADHAGAELLTLGSAAAEEVPAWVNAASAVIVSSDNEGFGLAAVEALACDVPVLSTPVGIAPTLLGGIDGCEVSAFDLRRWGEVASRHLDAPDPRVRGRERAAWFSAAAMAERVVHAYREALGAEPLNPAADLS